MSGPINEKQKPTTNAYRLNYDICYGVIKDQAELLKAKRAVNKELGYRYWKDVDDDKNKA